MVWTMSPISSARLPISFMTPEDSAIDARIRVMPVIDFATVAPPSRAADRRRSAVERAVSEICAIRRVDASTSIAAVALVAASCSIWAAVPATDWAERTSCSIDAALASMVAAVFSAVAATSSTDAAISVTVDAVSVADAWSCFA
jgi:hypothetical protein